MAIRDDLAVQILTAQALGTSADVGFDKIDIAEANKAIQLLAANPSPENRFEIAQITAFAVDNVMTQTEDWISKVADVKNTEIGEKAVFKHQANTIKAFIQAKGATTLRSKVVTNYISVDTFEVSARPYVNYLELAAGKVDFAQLILHAAEEMESKKLGFIDAVLRAAVAEFGTGVYGTGNGLVKETFNPILYNMQRLGRTTIMGDIAAVAKLNGISGFNGVNAPSDRAQDEIMKNGYIGNYLGANVIKINTPLKKGTFDPVVDKSFLYLLSGQTSPLKVVNEGPVTTMDATNLDDNSYEMLLRQNFGAAVALSDLPTIGAYEDSSL